MDFRGRAEGGLPPLEGGAEGGAEGESVSRGSLGGHGEEGSDQSGVQSALTSGGLVPTWRCWKKQSDPDTVSGDPM
eukprot:394347-Prorocentrum_minimum.AAC.1